MLSATAGVGLLRPASCGFSEIWSFGGKIIFGVSILTIFMDFVSIYLHIDQFLIIISGPSTHGQKGPIWAESGHTAQIRPTWDPYRHFRPYGAHIGPL